MILTLMAAIQALQHELLERVEAHEEAERLLHRACCALLERGDAETVRTPPERGGWIHRSLANDTLRDPHAPCGEYVERLSSMFDDALGDCSGDGHYLCRRCLRFAPRRDG